MSAVEFQLINDKVFTSADIVNGNVYVSPEQNNSSGTTYPALKAILDFKDFQSSDGAPLATLLIEGKSDMGDWYSLAYQFNGYGVVGPYKHQRIVVLQPDLFWPDAGIDNLVYVSGQGAVAQISNQQGVLSPKWRARIAISDPNGSFQSMKLSLYGERYGA